MTHIPTLRLDPAPAPAWTGLRLAVLALAAALGLGVVLIAAGAPDRPVQQAPFLERALGERAPDAPLVRTPVAGTTVRLGDGGGYRVQSGSADLALHNIDSGSGGELERFADGVARRTPFGLETVTVTPTKVEQYLTVTKRQGRKTWSWQLDTTLEPRLSSDGAVTFRSNSRPAALRIPPAAILDGSGRDITPAGTRWSLRRGETGWTLELQLDDSELPLPYVIDPAADYGPQLLYPTRTQSTVLGGGATNATPGQVYGLATAAPNALCTFATTNANTCPAVRDNVNTNGTFYSQVWNTSGVAPSTGTWLAAPQVPATGTAAVGGFLVNVAGTAAPTAIPAGSWTFEMWTDASATSAQVTANLTVGAWIVTTSGTGPAATIASVDATVINPTSAAATLATNLVTTTATTKRTLTVPAVAKTTLSASQRLYVRFYIKKITTTNQRLNGYLHLLVNGTNGTVTTPSSILHPTAVETPGAPAPTLPADNGWVTTANPTFSSTYATTGTNTGRLNVELCPDAGCGTQLETLNSTSSVLANGGTGTTPATATTLTNGTYYRWRAAGEVVTAANPVGATGVVSSWSAVRRFGVDLTNPTGSVTAPAASANVRGASVAVTSDSADGFSGVASVQFQRSPAGAGTWTAIGAADIVAPYSVAWDTTALADGLYDLRAVTTDNAGRTNTSAVVTNVRVDNTAPTQSLALTSLSPAGSTSLAGTNVFYRGTGGGSGGSFRIRNTVTDGGSGPASSTTGALGGTATGWSHTPGAVTTPAGGPYDSALLAWVEGTSSSPTVALSAADAAGNPTASSITLTLRNDSVAPSGGLLRVNGVDATGGGSASDSGGSFAIDLRGDWAEAASGTASGLASSTLTRDSAPYANGSCGSYSGSPTILIGTPAQALPTGCYRYVLTGLDNVGNSVALTTDVRVHGAPAQIELTGSTAGLPSGTSRLLTATIEDSAGNVAITDSSTVVTFAKQSGTGTVTGLGSATASAGVATTTVTGALAGALALEATSGALTADTLSFTVVHGAGAEIQLAESGSNASGNPHTLTATIRDAAGNTVTGDSATVVGFAKTSGLGSVSGLGSATASNGIATKAVTNVLAGSIDLEATAGGLTTGSTSYTIVHGTAAAVALSESGSTTSGGSHTLTATIRDAAGNTVTSDSTTPVAFAKASGTGTVTGLGSVTVTAGIANKTVTNVTAGPIGLEAAASGLSTGSTGYTIVHGAAASLELTESGSAASGATHTLTATLQDAAGNTVAGDSSTIVTFAKTGGAGTVTGLGAATASNGVATLPVTNALAGSIDLQASAAGLTAGSTTYTIAHGAAAQIQLSATGSSTSGASKTLTATLQDAAGNTVDSDSSTVVAFAKTGGAGTVTGLGTATATAGVATKVVTNALAGTIDLAATAAGLTAGADSYAIVPGAATALGLAESGSNASGDTHTLTATVVDSAGNTVTDDDSTVVTFAKTSGSGTVTGLDSVIATDGVATDTVTNVLAGAIGLDAQAPGLTAGSAGYAIVHGAAAELALTHSGSTTSGASNTLTATIRDAAGNTVTSDSSTVVGLAQVSGSGTVVGLGAATAAAGVASRSVTNALAGTVGLEASAPGLTPGAASYTVGHGAAAQLVLTHGGSALSGGDHTLTATVQDAAGNTVASDNSTVVTFSQTGGAGSVTGLGTAAASGGVATKTVTNAVAGTVDLDAQAGGLTPGSASYSVSAGAASTATSTISALPLSIVADGVAASTISVQLKDAVGNDVVGSGGIVALSRSGTGSLSAVTDNGDGTYTATLTSPTAVGSATISGTLNGAALADSELVTFTHGPATQIVLAQTGSNLSGTTQTLTATVRDANGNDVTGDSSTVVTFAKSGGAGSVTGLGAATASNGVATLPVTNALAGSIDLQASAAGLTASSTSYTIGHGAAAKIQLAQSGSNASGDSHTLTATVQDAAGNTVTADNSTAATFAKTGGAGTVAGLGVATASNGVATLTVTNVLAGPIDLAAGSGGLTPGTTSYTVVHGAAASIALAESGSSVSGSGHTLTATIEDAAGNTVSGDSSTLVTFAQTGGTGSVSGLGAATASSGIATRSVTNALVGDVDLSATATGLTGGSATFTIVHAAASQISLAVSGSSTSGADKTLTATIRDAAGNTVTSDSSTVVTFAPTSGPGSVTGLGTATASSGVASKIVTNALAGALVLEATSGALASGSAGYTIAHGAAAQVELVVSGSSVSGGDKTLTATIRDAAGNTVTSDSSTVVGFAKSSGAGTVAGLGASTAAAGVATKVATNVLAGSIDLEAAAAGLTTGTANYTVAHGAATQIDLDASGSNASGATKTLIATIQDAAGNTVTSDHSTLVGFAKSGGSGTVTGLGADTAANGIATLDVTNALAGQIDLAATAAGLTAGSTSWTIGAGAASTTTSTIDAAPSTIVADGASTSTVTVRLKDAAGNELAAGDGVVALSLSGTGSLGSVTDEGDGTYTTALTSPTAVGSGSITGTLNAVALADSAVVTYEHGPADAIVLTHSGSTVAGDAHTLTATIVDAHGNTVTSDNSTVVTFAKASGAGTVGGLGAATAANGIATKAVTNALAGLISLEATAAGLASGTTGYTIVAGPVSASTSTVDASPTSVQNTGADTSTITVTVRDVGGNPLSGETVSLDDDGADSVIAPASTTTNGSGVATFTATSTTIETAIYTATAGGIEVTDTASVSFVFIDTNGPTNTITLASGAGAFLTGTDLYYRPAAAGSFTLSSAVADGGSGPASAAYPAVGETGWTHALETVTTPAAGPYVSSPFSWTAAAAGDFSIEVTAADGWTPANTSETTIDVLEDSSAPTGQTISLGGGSVHAALSVPFVLGDGVDLGSGLDPSTRLVGRESALLVDGACGTFAPDVGVFASPDTSVQSGHCYRYSFTLEDRVGNTSAAVTSAVAQIDTAAPPAPVQTVTETGDDGHASGSTLYYDPAGSGSFTVTSAVADGESGIDKVGFAAPATGFASLDPADDSTPPYARSYSWAAGATGSGAQAVTALDRAGHSAAGSFTLTPDAADPTVSFDAPAGGTMLDSGSHALEATAGDAGAGVASVLFEVSSTGAGGPFTAIGTTDTSAPYAVSWDTSTLSDGPKVLRATATDNVGHTAAVTRSVAVDKVPGAPVTSITSQPADPSANTTPTFGFGSSETPSTFECRIDGAGWGSCPSPHTVTPALGDGSHTLEVRASDAAGNQDATPESYTWAVDATAPTGALTAPAALAAVSGTAVVVTSDSADGGSGVQHALFEVLVAGTWQALGAPDPSAPYSVLWNTTGLADGDHDLRVTTRDNAGNSTVSAVRTVTVDNSLPLLSASVSHNPVNLTTPDPAQVSAVADDLGSGIANVLFEQCNETSAACTSDTWTTLVGPDTVAPYEVDWAIPSDGPRLLRVTATDNAGRSAVDLILTTVDRTRPSGTVTAPAAGADLRGSVALAATASDSAPGSVNTVTFQVSPAGAGVWADLGTDGSAPYGATLDTTTLTDGLYDLRVFTTDASGNAEATPATTSVRVDNTAPATTDDAPTGWRNGDVVVTLTAGDPGGSGVAQTEYRLDGGATQPFSAPVTVSGEGVHTLEYRSRDSAGNWEGWQTASVRIDETDPATADDAPAAWQAGATSVTLSPTDAGGSGLATTTYELDGGATQAGSTVNVPATHGTHTITYRSTDAAGNVEADRSASVRIDRQAPTTSDDAPAGLRNLPVTVTLAAADPDSGVSTTTYEVNGGATQTGTSVSIAASTGTYTITYRSTDAVGNVEATRTAAVQIDATAPATSATISPRNPNNGPITVSLSTVDAGGAGVDETRFRIDGGTETVGSSALVDGRRRAARGALLLGRHARERRARAARDRHDRHRRPHGHPGQPGWLPARHGRRAAVDARHPCRRLLRHLRVLDRGRGRLGGPAGRHDRNADARRLRLQLEHDRGRRRRVRPARARRGRARQRDGPAPAEPAQDGRQQRPDGDGLDARRWQLRLRLGGARRLRGRCALGYLLHSDPAQAGRCGGLHHRGQQRLRGSLDDLGQQLGRRRPGRDQGRRHRRRRQPDRVGDRHVHGRQRRADRDARRSRLCRLHLPHALGDRRRGHHERLLRVPGDRLDPVAPDRHRRNARRRLLGDLVDRPGVGGDVRAARHRHRRRREHRHERDPHRRSRQDQPDRLGDRPCCQLDDRRLRRRSRRGRRGHGLGRARRRLPRQAVRLLDLRPGRHGRDGALHGDVGRVERGGRPGRDSRARHRRRGQHAQLRSRPRHTRLHRPERHAHRSRRCALGHRRARRDDRRRRHPRALRGQPCRCGQLDGARNRRDRAVRRRSGHGRTRRRRLRPARHRLRRARQPLGPLGAGGRALRQHGAVARLLGSGRRLGLDVGKSDRAHRERAGDGAGRAPRRRSGPRAGRLRLHADLRHGLARRRPPRPLRRARGRERDPHAIPGRGHDREHASGRSAAGRAQHHVVGQLDADDPGRPRDREDAAERVAHAPDAAGLHPRASRRCWPEHRGGRRLRPGDADRRGDGPLGDGRHVRDRVQRPDRDHLLEPDRRPRRACVVVERHVRVEHDGRARRLHPAGRRPRRLPQRRGRRARAHPPPHLLRPDARRRGADAAEAHRGRRRR